MGRRIKWKVKSERWKVRCAEREVYFWVVVGISLSLPIYPHQSPTQNHLEEMTPLLITHYSLLIDLLPFHCCISLCFATMQQNVVPVSPFHSPMFWNDGTETSLLMSNEEWGISNVSPRWGDYKVKSERWKVKSMELLYYYIYSINIYYYLYYWY